MHVIVLSYPYSYIAGSLSWLMGGSP